MRIARQQHPRAWLLVIAAAGMSCLCSRACAASTARQQADAQPAAQGAEAVSRIEGVDAGSGSAYVLLTLNGRRMDDSVAASPQLTAQCSRDVRGKLHFEVLADLGKDPSPAFDRPWQRTDAMPFPPALEKVVVVMEFLGYTHVKPVKRIWERLPDRANTVRYANPGLHSPNLEDFGYYLQFLHALPTLRLTATGEARAEWDTTAWLKRVQTDPLCGASGF